MTNLVDLAAYRAEIGRRAAAKSGKPDTFVLSQVNRDAIAAAAAIFNRAVRAAKEYGPRIGARELSAAQVELGRLYAEFPLDAILLYQAQAVIRRNRLAGERDKFLNRRPARVS